MTPASTFHASSRLQRIDDPDDPRLEDYRLIRERDLVGRKGRFIAEGVVVLEKLVDGGRHPLRSVLISERRAPALSGLIARLGPGVPAYLASQTVMDAVAGFAVHRGVLGAGERSEPTVEALLAGLPEQALVVALVGVSNHDNMGGLFRNAAAFGAAAVVLDATCCDPLYRKAIRVSVGATLTTPFARLFPGADVVAVLREAGCETLALSPAGQETLSQVRPASRQAVLFGAEGPGLPAVTLAAARTVRIPMAGGFDSLNVATASSIVLHRLAELRG